MPAVAPAEMDRLYHELKPVIRKTARRFAARYNRDPEEYEARANLIFVEALAKHDPEKGRIEPRITFLIWNRLLDEVRRFAKSGELQLTEGIVRRTERNQRAPRPRPTAAEMLGLLSPDARLVAEMVLNADPELNYGAEADRNPGRVRAALRGELQGRGWTHARTVAAFEELSGLTEVSA